MTVEEAISEPGDQFPVGMRVLAVDDDPTCLMVLQTLLRRCQYQVTTTSQAISALKLLRENKNQFDLVISDVHMPDMDGFKLLELVGLEMDLPVIMLSGNGDPKLVMKGITHGACDYLLKPVRIEELKNIWQHVVRRKKKERKNPNAAESKDKSFDVNCESGGMGNADQIAKNNKRRKDQDEEEDEERDDSDNEDPSAQKKPRVVWTVELHRKFVGAVNQLGVDKAVPKKILELMNVDKLTRENVASHLQKYRLYLKRISCVANQQANLAAALGTADPSYLQMSSLNIQNLNGFGSFHSLGGSDQFQNAAFRSLPSTGMLGRLNSPAGMGIRSLPSPGLMQLGQAKSSSNVNNNPNRFQQVMIPGNYNGSVLQGMPLSLEHDNKGVNRNEPLPLAVDNSSLTGCSSTPLLGVANEQPLLLEGRPHESKGGAMYGNQSSVTIASMNPGSSSSHLPDLGRCSDNWSNAVMSSGVQANSFDLSDCLQPATSLPSNLADSISPVAFQNGNVSDLQGQEDASSYDVPQQWNGGCYRQDAASYASNLVNNSRNSTLDGTIASFRQCLDQNNAVFPRNMNLGGSTGQPNYVDSNIQGFGTSSGNANPGYVLGQQRMQGRYIHNNIGSLEDLASIMVKQEVRPSGDFCNNPGSYRTCSS